MNNKQGYSSAFTATELTILKEDMPINLFTCGRFLDRILELGNTAHKQNYNYLDVCAKRNCYILRGGLFLSAFSVDIPRERVRQVYYEVLTSLTNFDKIMLGID